MPIGCCFHSSISDHVASLKKLCGLKKIKEVWHHLWSCYSSRVKFSSVKKGLKFHSDVAQEWISSLWLKSPLSFCNGVLHWRVTNALSWAKKGRGLEETITTSHKPPSAPIHKDMLLVHVSVARQTQNLLLLSLGVPDSISNHQTKASSAFSACLTALLPHTDLSRSIPRPKGSNSPAVRGHRDSDRSLLRARRTCSSRRQLLRAPSPRQGWSAAQGLPSCTRFPLVLLWTKS